MFVLTERRIALNKVDCLCCMTSGGPRVPTAATVWFEDGTGGPGGSDAIGAGASSHAAYYDAPSAVVLQARAPGVASAPSRGAGAGPVAESTAEGQPQRGSPARSESASSSGVTQQVSMRKGRCCYVCASQADAWHCRGGLFLGVGLPL